MPIVDLDQECFLCGTLILVSKEELEESEDVVCSHCDTTYRYDYDNGYIVLR